MKRCFLGIFLMMLSLSIQSAPPLFLTPHALIQEAKSSDGQQLLELSDRIASGKTVVKDSSDSSKAAAYEFLYQKLKKQEFLMEAWKISMDDSLINQFSTYPIRMNALFASIKLAEETNNPEISRASARRLLNYLLSINNLDDVMQAMIATDSVSRLGKQLDQDSQLDLLINGYRLLVRSDIDNLDTSQYKKFRPYDFLAFYIKDIYKIHVDYMASDQLKKFNNLRNIYTAEYVSKIVSSKKLTNDEKLEYLSQVFSYVTAGENSVEVDRLRALAEPIIFYEYKNQQSISTKFSLLLPLVLAGNTWPFLLSKEQANELIIRQARLSTRPDVALMVYWMSAMQYSNDGQFLLADKQFSSARRLDFGAANKDMGPDFSRILITITNFMQLKSFMDRGDLKSVLDNYQTSQSQMNFLIDSVVNKYPTLIPMLGGLVILPEIDLKMGNYQKSIDSSMLILRALGGDGLDSHSLNRAKEKLFEILADAYSKSGDEEQASEYDLKAFRANLMSRQLNSTQAISYFYREIRQEEYKAASSAIDNISDALKGEARTSYEIQLNSKYIDSLRSLVSELESGIDKKVALKNHYQLVAPILEDYLHIVESSSNKFSLLGTYDSLFFAYKNLDDGIYAGYYAKQYINLFQELRASLDKNSTQLNTFTEAYSDTLKKYVDNFLEINDIESAQITLKIIKENNYYDFINKRGGSKILGSKVRVSDEDKAITQKMQVISAEVSALTTQLNVAKGKSVQADIVKIQAAIDFRNKRIEDLRKELRQSIYKDYGSKKIDGGSRENISISEGEALVDYFVQASTVTVLITTKDGSKSYVKNISRVDFRKKLLNFYIGISNVGKIKNDEELVEYFSDVLSVKEILQLRSKNIRHLKIRTDDLIGYLPFDILGLGPVALVDLFDIQIQGLGKLVSSKRGGESILAFGTTKKFNQFTALPHVAEEVSYISGLIIPKIDVKKRNYYLDRDFNKKALIQTLKSSEGYIHIATHYSSNQFGVGGSLLLGDGSVMSTSELINEIPPLNNVPLVTLSACETGIGSLNGGISQFEGLSNIFNTKGAQYVIGTLWKVSDQSTADFMRLLYKLIVQGRLDPPIALQATKLVFKTGDLQQALDGFGLKAVNDEFIPSLKNRLSGYSDPYYWAGFELIGG